MTDYYPLSLGKKWLYVAVTFSRPPLIRQISRKVESLKRKNGETIAVIRESWGDGKSFTYRVKKNSKGIWAGKDLLFPAVLKAQDQWEDSSRYPYCGVESTDASVQTPRGKILHCLKITATDQNTGSIERYYAQGKGLVYEKYAGEESSWTMFLVDFD